MAQTLSRNDIEAIRARYPGQVAKNEANAAEALSDETRADLYARAQDLKIKGRTKMDADELAAAIAEAESPSSDEDGTTGDEDA